MQGILLGLGVIAGIAGIGLIGFGSATHASNLAPTFIVTGVVALIGGVIMLGISSVLRRLRRIALSLEPRPLPRAIGPELEVRPVARMQANLAFARSPGEIFRHNNPEPVVLEPIVQAPADVQPPPAEDELREPVDTAITQEKEENSDNDAEEIPEPLVPPVITPVKTFDAVWPTDQAADPTSERDQAPPADDTALHELTHKESQGNKPSSQHQGETPEGLVIFKSGVIDGMTYTLYTDGSIEAELPQGKMRFSSIEELSAYVGRGP